jgi:hypothetical protein
MVKKKPFLRKTSSILTFNFTSASKGTIASLNDFVDSNEDISDGKRVKSLYCESLHIVAMNSHDKYHLTTSVLHSV